MAKTKIIITLITTLIIITLLTCVVTGCSNEKTAEQATSTETPTTEETESKSTLDIPNAKDFDVIEWPTFGIVEKIPIPTWSDRGELLTVSETLFWSEVGYATIEDFDNYIKECQEYGFSENQYNDPGYIYYGENADGQAIQLTYNQWDNYIAIQVTNNADTWDKWWEEYDFD